MGVREMHPARSRCRRIKNVCIFHAALFKELFRYKHQERDALEKKEEALAVM